MRRTKAGMFPSRVGKRLELGWGQDFFHSYAHQPVGFDERFKVHLCMGNEMGIEGCQERNKIEEICGTGQRV